MPLQRGFSLVASLALVLGAVLPFVAPSATRAAPTDLFFSQYIEGTGNNKALEIYNGTGAPVNLATAGYSVQMFFNGSGTSGLTINLTGTVANGDVFVIAHSSANAAILAQADETNGAGWFNGDDAVVLRKGTTVIDVIGQIGFDPGSEWGAALTSTADNTLRRKAAIEAGDINGADAFDPAAEWDGFATDTFDGLGAHTVSDTPQPTDPTGVGAADPASVMVGETTLLTLTVVPGTNPASIAIAVSADLSAIGGSATQAFFDDGTNGDVTVGDNIFSYTATVTSGSGAASLPVTITDAQDRTGTTSISLTVESAPSEIWQIQGASHLSSLDGEEVFGVEGVVTAVTGNGFWMTDPTPDADPATSDGIFVFRSREAKPAVGDLVSVNGTVDEFRPGGSGGSENLTTTEIVSFSPLTIVSSNNDLPTTVIGVDRMPPTEVIDDDSTDSVEASNAVYDPQNDGIDFWESLEGMRLQVADAVAVGPTNGFGEVAVISEAQEAAGLRTPRGGILVRNLTGSGDYQPGDFNPERVILDDVLNATPKLNTGDEFVTDPVGVLDYGFGNFKLLITEDPGRVDNGLTREVTADQGPHDLAVATFNVENLSAVDCVNEPDKVATLASQIVNNLRAPDLIAIEEMQDNSGDVDDEPDGDDGTVASDLSWQCLIRAIVAAGGPVYDYRQIDPVDGEDGGIPGGNIRVGFLFNSDRGLEFVDRPGGDATTDTNVVPTPNRKGAQLTVSPGRVLDTPGGMESAFVDTRKSLAGEFRWRGETIFVIANHFSSKGDDRPLFGHFQPPYRLTELESGDPEDGWRHAQAQTINDFVDEILAVDPDANVIVLGDINDFDFSETVEVLTGERTALDPGPFMPDPDGSGQTAASGEEPVMHTLFETLPANERYSYVFDGNSQVLDQILVSNALFDSSPTYDVVHVNAEFFDQASDHDPSVMRVAFQPRSSSEVTGATAPSRGR
ncbi:MAG TPA: lamin tail domain-containing protein [Candidatus Limnocylindria bacterium]|nr:lamin tail domain-containing protein [Candidatus Limnocylindria bacterium]